MPLLHGRADDLPARAKLLSLDEIAIIAERFIARGVTRIRLSGGEPLVRRDVVDLVKRLGGHVGHGLDELTMTTNGTRLADHADALVNAGVRRINVSLDSRDPERFRYITRHGDVGQVIHGILSARDAGLAIKINMVALKGMNEDEIASMLSWCVSERWTCPDRDDAAGRDRRGSGRPLPSADRRVRPAGGGFPLVRAGHRTGGPARYWQVEGSQTRLGLISPLTANFCDGCNRVRLTTEGKLYMCLGHEDQVDLKAALRDGASRRWTARSIGAGGQARPA